MYPSLWCHPQATLQCHYHTNSTHLFLTHFTYPNPAITILPSFHGLGFPWIMQHFVFSYWLHSISNRCHFLHIFPWFCTHSFSLLKSIPPDDVTRFLRASWLFPSFSSYAANIHMQIFRWALSIKFTWETEKDYKCEIICDNPVCNFVRTC